MFNSKFLASPFNRSRENRGMRVRDFPVSLNKTRSIYFVSPIIIRSASRPTKAAEDARSPKGFASFACLLEKAAALNAPKACKWAMALFDFHR